MAPQPVPQPEADVLWHLNVTPEQHALLEELRAELTSRGALTASLDDDLSLLRFLKARHWDLRRAIDMYQNMSNWRRTQGIAELMQNFRFPERAAVRCVYPHFYHKTDRYGRPVYYERVGRVDFTRLLSITTHERLVTYHVSLSETFRLQKLPACSAMMGRQVLGLVVVLDLEGFSLREFAVARELLTDITRIDQSYFPEHLGAMFIINAPVLFRSAWAIVKAFLDPRTLGKIKVLGSAYQSELLALIPEENLPVRFGGTSAANEMEDEGPWSDWAGAAALSPRAGATSPPLQAGGVAPLTRMPSSALSGELLEVGEALAVAIPCSAAATAAGAEAVGVSVPSRVSIGSRRSSRASSQGGSPGLGLLLSGQHPNALFADGASSGADSGVATGVSVPQHRRSLVGETIEEEGTERIGSGSSSDAIRVASLMESWPAAGSGAAAAGALTSGAQQQAEAGALAGALAGKLAIGERMSSTGIDAALPSPRVTA